MRRVLNFLYGLVLLVISYYFAKYMLENSPVYDGWNYKAIPILGFIKAIYHFEQATEKEKE